LLSAGVAGGAIEWQQRFQVSLPAFEVVIMAGEAPVRVAAEADALQVELAGNADGLDGGRVVLSGGAFKLPAHQLRVSGIDAEAHLSAGALDPGRPIPIAVAAIVHDGAPPWSAPLRLQGTVQPDGDRITFDAKMAHTAGAIEMRVRGQHDLATAKGRAQVDLPPIDLAPGKLQPGQLSPWLGDMMKEVSGRLALDGTLGWGARDGLDADLDLLVERLAFTAGPARFEQVNGVITLDQLMPPSTPPGQQLAVGLVDLGLPLTDGLLTFDLESGQLIMEQLRWQFAEGRIRATPFTIGSQRIQFSTTLTAERLRLDEIFALAQLDGLTGEGTMHGTLPITVTGSEAIVEGGELVSDRDEELRLTIDGRTDGEMDVGLHLKGANPDLYDGYPIEFNLNLEGALADVVRAGLAGYQIPERIREQMQGFGR
jgi:hypothetical protein